jgi:2-polyprenyl-6-hydroxyphenyl methylase/3-demethylubiquinone-9 3-methyltransferase
MEFPSAAPVSSTPYLLAPIQRLAGDVDSRTRVLDVGCGNGFWAGLFAARGSRVVAIDPSRSGIDIGRDAYPTVRFEQYEIDSGLLERLDEEPFDVIVSTEVVEHLYDPPLFAASCFEALKPGGRIVLSTPYHGRLKNLLLAASGRLDAHHEALRVGGHIKFFSRLTLEQLLSDAGFRDLRFAGAGRVTGLWKSMVVSGRRPAAESEASASAVEP